MRNKLTKLTIKVKFIECLCYRLNVFLPNSFVETLTPNVVVLGGGAFGMRLNHEDRAS